MMFKLWHTEKKNYNKASYIKKYVKTWILKNTVNVTK